MNDRPFEKSLQIGVRCPILFAVKKYLSKDIGIFNHQQTDLLSNLRLYLLHLFDFLLWNTTYEFVSILIRPRNEISKFGVPLN